MTDSELLKLLGGGGLAAALLGLIYLVGMRLVSAIGELVKSFNAHSGDEAKHHTEVKAEIAGFRERLDTIIEWQERTPVETPVPIQRSQRARSEITPIGGRYSQHSKKPDER